MNSKTQAQSAQISGDSEFVHYQVKSGETLYALSRKYQVSQQELIKLNPSLKSGMKAGEIINVPIHSASSKQPTIQIRFHEYKVKRKNTLEFIAQIYQVSVEDILTYNPDARNGIRRGDRLKIPYREDLAKLKAQGHSENGQTPNNYRTHRVVANETVFGLSRKYHISVDALLAANPKVKKDGLKNGMLIRIPSNSANGIVTSEPDSIQPTSGKYFYYLVVSGDTFWHLAQKYHISQTELISLNPALQEGLKAGLRIRIPLRNQPKLTVVPDNRNLFVHYPISKGETLYGISRKFNVRITELQRINPLLSYRGLMEGDTILIPKVNKEVAPSSVDSPVRIMTSSAVSAIMNDSISDDFGVRVAVNSPDSLCPSDSQSEKGAYHVALFLPLYLEANDTINRIHMDKEQMMADSAIMSSVQGDSTLLPADTFKIRSPKVIYPASAHFLEFYEGVMLAMDSLQKAGMNVQLNVYDTNPDHPHIDSLLQLPEMRTMDLIIGPVFPTLQAAVSDFSARYRIPMVSPLSADGNFEETNPYYFKVNPNKKYQIRKTADYISQQYYDKNFIVLKMGEYKLLPEAQLVDLCREKFFSSDYGRNSNEVLFHNYDYEQEDYNGLSRILSPSKENVFVIPAEKEGQVSVGVTNLNALSEDYPVTLVGTSNFLRYKSIQIEYFHHTNLHLLSPYFVDYHSKIVNNFVRRYRSEFSAEPSQFSFQGYDVAYYFMNALFRYGKNFVSCLSENKIKLTQGAFYFDKVSANGGYMNHGLFIVHYLRDYDIVVDGVVGQPIDYQLKPAK